MTKFSRDDVLKLAKLARIDLRDDEIDAFVAEFTAILGYVEQLKEVDVNGLEPTSQVTGLTNVMRPDVVKDYGYSASDLMAGVPNVQGSLIKVKRMIG